MQLVVLGCDSETIKQDPQRVVTHIERGKVGAELAHNLCLVLDGTHMASYAAGYTHAKQHIATALRALSWLKI